MKPKLILFALATASLLPALRAEESKYPPINPALLYWQAAAISPKLTDEQAGELRDTASGKKPIDPAKMEALKLGAAGRILRKAAESTAPCDWGLMREDGPGMLMPHLSKLREMANIATAQAEVLLAQGKTGEGLDWLLVTHRIARHSGTGETLISYLVQASIEDLAVRAAARHCLGWDEATRHGYADRLKALPPLHSLQENYRGEKIFADWFEGLSKFDGPVREEKLKEFFGADSGNNEEAARLKAQLQTLFTGDTFDKEIAANRAMTARIEATLGKPWKEASPELRSLTEEVAHSGFVMVKSVVPAVSSCLDRAGAIATLRTMLDVALQLGPGLDPSSIANYADSFEGHPLQLKKGEDGALSLSALTQHPKGKTTELKLGK